jgi:hypothetical protein
MRVIKMGRSRFGKIDPKKEKPRNSEKEREIRRETSLFGEFFFISKKKNQRRFPLWPLYHNKAFLGGRKLTNS